MRSIWILICASITSTIWAHSPPHHHHDTEHPYEREWIERRWTGKALCQNVIDPDDSNETYIGDKSFEFRLEPTSGILKLIDPINEIPEYIKLIRIFKRRSSRDPLHFVSYRFTNNDAYFLKVPDFALHARRHNFIAWLVEENSKRKVVRKTKYVCNSLR